MKRFVPVLALVACCWVVFALNQVLSQGGLNRFGIIPRYLPGLPGILFAPFLHESYAHLAANTMPLLILGGILCARSRAEFVLVTAFGILLGGAMTWLFARTASHIGASGLVFCYLGYLGSLAWFRGTFGTLVVSLICIVGYGGLIRGVLPGADHVSWESHLAGLVAGIVLAWAGSRILQAPLEAKPVGLELPKGG
jgi:membrane associated rhomboid family serine protease